MVSINEKTVIKTVFFSLFFFMFQGISALCVKNLTCNAKHLASIDVIITQAIEKKQLPGAVVLVGHQGKIVYLKAFGARNTKPTFVPMTTDTIFDVASLTKPIVTATLILQLVEQGIIRLSDTVATYLPFFKARGKENITIEQMLTHRSGLASNLPLNVYEHGKDFALKTLLEEPLECLPEEKFIYSCSNYIILGHLIEQVTGKTLDVLAIEKIFDPLGMKDTGFLPQSHPNWATRIAPTAPQKDGTFCCGIVHDPRAQLLGGVTGNAGLFSTATDLAFFCQMMLSGGSYPGGHILRPLTIIRMTHPRPMPTTEIHGLGWDISSKYSAPRGDFFLSNSFGHSGFTGVSLWIDPATETFVIFLSNRLHPDGDKRSVKDLYAKIGSIVASSLE